MNCLTKKSYEHMDENSDNDLCDHYVRTSDIPEKSDNQQINEHTYISTPSLQINPDIRHHDSFASSVMGSLTSDNTNDDKITNSIKPFCYDLTRRIQFVWVMLFVMHIALMILTLVQ